MDIVSKERRSALMANIKSKNTKPEMIVRSITHRLGYRYRLHKKDLPGKPDLTFTKQKKVIFVNGCFWHMHTCSNGSIPKSNTAFWTAKLQSNADRDKVNLNNLKRLGWRVLTIWECQTKDAAKLSDRIDKFLTI